MDDPLPQPTPRTWVVRLRGHDYELDVHSGLDTRLVLRIDGEQVHDSTSGDETRRIRIDERRRVVVRLSFTGRIRRASVHDGDVELDLEAPPGSTAARRQAWGRTHPVLFAMRHVAVKGLGVLLVVLGVGALIKGLLAPYIRQFATWVASWMPDIELPSIPWPDVDLPEIPWPPFPWPQMPWPQVRPPDWLVAILDADEYWKPILIGLGIALFEVRRQARQRRLRERGVDAVEPKEEKPEAGPKPSLREWFRRELAKLEAEEEAKERAKAPAAGGPEDPPAATPKPRGSSGAQVPPGEAEERQPDEDEAPEAERGQACDVDAVREG